MRTVYRAVAQNDKNPLHTHHSHQQFRDPMPPTQVEMQTRRQFLLAQVLGLLTQVTNQVTGYPEIRLEYLDKQSGLRKTQTLGSSFEEAEAYLLNDLNRRISQILDEQVRAIGHQAKTRLEKQQLYQRLMNSLQEKAANLPGGKDHPEYRKLESAIEDFITSFSLYVGESLPSAPSVSAVAVVHTVSAENLEKYRKLVETCFRKGHITKTEQELLSRFQTKYGIPDSLAQQIVDEFKPNSQEGAYEYALMLRSFLENDGVIDPEELAQLIELQDELNLSNEQVALIEKNVRDELGLH